MTRERSPTLALRVRGPLAVFTEPAFKAERVSYAVMTPSAARGLLEAVLWKPAMCWHVRRIRVLAPIRFVAFRRNEVNRRAVTPARTLVQHGGRPPALYVDEEGVRAQRNTIALRDVDYVIEAEMSLTPRAGADERIAKFAEMFQRRLEKGQHFHQPYLGCREFAADVQSADGAPQPIPVTRSLGVMLLDIAYGRGQDRAHFFEARLENGVLDVPPAPLAMAGGPR